MRDLEWVLVALNLIALLAMVIPRHWRPRAQAFIPALGFMVMLLHLVLEGYRWQMMPSYVLTLLLATFAIPAMVNGYSRDKAGWGARLFGLFLMVLGLVMWVAATLPPYLLPVFELPEPSGPHAVGTVDFHLEDSSRPETMTELPNDSREMMVTAWYPVAAGTETGSPVPYLPQATVSGSILSRALRLPSYTFTYLGLVDTHAYYGVPAVAGPLPVLLFSHGYMPGFGRQNTIQMEELASHGYVVFAIHHPYEAAAVRFPERGIVAGDVQRMNDMRAEYSRTKELRLAYETATGAAKVEAARNYFAALPLRRETLDRWTEDVFFILGQLSDIEAGQVKAVRWGPGRQGQSDGDNPLAGRLDLARMGIFGMEMGGMVAAQACLMSDAFAAGLNYDGLPVGAITDLQRDVPFLMLYAEQRAGEADALLAKAFEPAYSGTVQGATMYNFNDFSVVSDFFQGMGFLGEIDGDEMSQLLSTVTLAYFDHYVKEGETTAFAFQRDALQVQRHHQPATAESPPGEQL